MRSPKARSFLYRSAVFAQVLGGALASVVAISQNLAKPQTHAPALLAPVASWFSDRDWWLGSLGLVLVGVGGIARKRIGDQSVWDVIHEALDKLRDEVFRGVAVTREDEHRVTLFQHKAITWNSLWQYGPFKLGFLVPVERSGEMTRRTKTVLRADRSNPQGAEGVAGQAWAQKKRGVSIVTGLEPVDGSSSAASVRAYAEGTNVPEKWLLRWFDRNPGKKAPVSFCGIRVERSGRDWGVILLDSCAADAVDATTIEPIYAHFAWFVGKMLERA
jgi:hypothetical protein